MTELEQNKTNKTIVKTTEWVRKKQKEGATHEEQTKEMPNEGKTEAAQPGKTERVAEASPHSAPKLNTERAPDSIELFRKLGITEPVLRAITEQGFVMPTEVQIKSIPLVVDGKDIIAGAATGSGKTLAFGSGIIQNSERGKGIQALILTPTRELAEQIKGALNGFSKYKSLRITAVYGGVGIMGQINSLRSADVVVGTPGRLLDHMQRKTIDLRCVSILVLDEADRMLDMGFLPDVERIINSCPKKRQTLLFSATVSTGISKLAQKYMNAPIDIAAESQVDPRMLKQVYYDVRDSLKFSLLVHLLKHENSSGLVMVFCNTRRYVDQIADNLKANGISAIAIHGGQNQSKRNKTMQQFHAQNIKVLVCTDVAARGLDIKGVSHIYNYDIPKESKQYIHRIGRTARAGKEGKAINILSSRDYENFGFVKRDTAADIKREEVPYVEQAVMKRTENKRSNYKQGGGRGRPQGGNRGRPQGGNRAKRTAYTRR
ncbi:MAG: DEAD/DEAH box helicase [archaeon]